MLAVCYPALCLIQMPREVSLDGLIQGLLEFNRMLRGQDHLANQGRLVGIGAQIEKLQHHRIVTHAYLHRV